MAGETDLQTLLKSMSPMLADGDFVFCTFPNAEYGSHANLNPIASMQEAEGLTLVIPKENADAEGITYDTVFSCITLTVHSSLDAVGLTAAFARKLTENNISANVVAGFYHDHLFVAKTDAAKAMKALSEFSQ